MVLAVVVQLARPVDGLQAKLVLPELEVGGPERDPRYRFLTVVRLGPQDLDGLAVSLRALPPPALPRPDVGHVPQAAPFRVSLARLASPLQRPLQKLHGLGEPPRLRVELRRQHLRLDQPARVAQVGPLLHGLLKEPEAVLEAPALTVHTAKLEEGPGHPLAVAAVPGREETLAEGLGGALQPPLIRVHEPQSGLSPRLPRAIAHQARLTDLLLDVAQRAFPRVVALVIEVI